MEIPKIKIIQYKAKTYANGTHPIMLRATLKGKRKKVSFNYSCLPNEWNNETCRFTRKFKGYKAANEVLRKLENRALDIVEKYKTNRKSLTLERFINEFENTSSNAVFPFFDKRIQELEQAGKIGNMNAYKTARAALWRYCSQSNIQFTDIDYKFLHSWEVFLRKEGCTNGGISNYMRTFRALYNLEPVKNYNFLKI